MADVRIIISYHLILILHEICLYPNAILIDSIIGCCGLLYFPYSTFMMLKRVTNGGQRQQTSSRAKRFSGDYDEAHLAIRVSPI